jgi:hypothetical protein
VTSPRQCSDGASSPGLLNADLSSLLASPDPLRPRQPAPYPLHLRVFERPRATGGEHRAAVANPQSGPGLAWSLREPGDLGWGLTARRFRKPGRPIAIEDVKPRVHLIVKFAARSSHPLPRPHARRPARTRTRYLSGVQIWRRDSSQRRAGPFGWPHQRGCCPGPKFPRSRTRVLPPERRKRPFHPYPFVLQPPASTVGRIDSAG